MKPGNIFIIAAPSGAGKSSLVKELCQLDNNIKVSISHTTRSMRSNEEHGKDYFFVSKNEFEQILAHNGFLEHASVYDNYYGTSVKFVADSVNAGCDLILEIDWQGALQIKKIYPKAISIYILPPSKEELRRRLEERKTDTLEVINKRMLLALDDISHAKDFDYVVVNTDFTCALHDIYSIIKASKLTAEKTLETYKF